ncbi:MAG: zinc-binding protein [Candidatus Handelsmanbacteria bacterium RIFCSPLOWO2_12_FULL_64_10]|uniref:Zinc-binding protein n=1 Tax=Handelsmanbacteria sp. (strain RIFCSPLOWO2_12_FULL_64_10) TaxID=1817868 RepID=A0A1F6D0J6_HANXR|nr:MAG: zinc-binding protein [Candidatus Handelsmanbacteria bacterium RIFCSPLOWO2_12_FULL_64_10]
MSTDNDTCACNAAPKLIFPCSGASDVGEVADRAARKLTREGAGKMYCLAGIGGRVSGIMASTESASMIFAIDGCPLECATNTLKQAGFTNFRQLRLSDIGMEKGESPATDGRIGQVVARGKVVLSA